MTKKEKLARAIQEGKITDKTTAAVFVMVEDLKEEIDQKLQEFKSQELSLSKIFEQVKKLKGNDGLTPTDKELTALIKPLIPDIEKMIDDKMPSKSELLAIIQPIIPKVRDGSTPTKQELVGLISPLIPDFKTITEEIITKIEAKIPKTPEIDELIPKLPQLGEPIRDSLELLKDDERLDIKAVKGLDDYDEISGLAKQPKGIGGGGSTARNFYQLYDVPQSYAGNTGKALRVNTDETALEFYTVSDTDEKVKYDSGDPTAGYLSIKIVGGTNIVLAEGTGANENKLVINSTASGAVSDTAYAASWDGVTDVAPSKNAVYDKIETLGGGHDAVTLDANADTLLSLSTQALGLDTQTANLIFAGPTTGAAAVPAFRSLVAGDIPDISATYQPLDADLTAIAALGFASTSFLKKTGADTWALDTNTYLTSVTAHDILSATHGDTTAAAVVRGDIIIGSGVTPKWTRLAVGASTTFLKGGTEPAWATLNQAAVAGLTTADSPTFTGILLSGLSASEIVITDASKNLISAAVATYPSLAELAYVKGVTSALQGQIDGKAATNQTMYIGTTAVAINRASAALTLAGITLTTPDIGTPSAGIATNITGLVPGNLVAGTLAVAINLGEGADPATIGLVIDGAMSADERYSGITVPGTAGTTLAFGDLCYLDVTATEWLLADASAIATAGNVVLGICVDASTDGNATSMLLIGTVRSAAFPASIALGAPVYISETAGDVTATAPTTTDSVMRRVGFAVTAEPNTIFFFPSNDYITHT